MLRTVAAGYTTVSEVSTETGLALATTARILDTLQQAGALTRTEKRYRIGPTIIELVHAEATTLDLLGIAKPHLHALADATQETAGLAELVGDDIVHLGQVATEHDVSVRDWTGFRIGLHSGAIGMAILAHRPRAEIDRYLASPLEQYVEQSVIDPDAIRTRLDLVRDQGWLATVDEYDQGVTTVAAPVFDRSGCAIASLHVHGPTYRFPAADLLEDVANHLVERTRTISRVLGHGGTHR